MPDPNSCWPPKPLETVYGDMARWSAWFSGDPDELSRVYGGYGGARDLNSTGFIAKGGLVRAVQRFFWGSKPTPGEQRTKLHIPLASEIAQVSADLLFGEPPTVTVEDDDTTQARIDELIGEDAGIQLHEAAEMCAALGHVYLRVGWDRDIEPDGPLLSIVDADAALPVYRYDRLQEVTFVREWAESGTVLRHLELHEKGWIWHSAYLGDGMNLGRQVPLSAYPQTADLADADMVADPDRAGSGIPTGLDRLDVVGTKNAQTRRWRHLPAAQGLGRPDIAGSEGMLDALDDVWSSWLRDIRHGRSRIHVPMHMMDNKGLGQGASFDLDRELYVGLTSPPDGPLQLQETQFKIRWQEHSETARSLTESIVSGCGYSLQTFGLDPSTSTQTATESWARQMRSQKVRDGKIRHWKRSVRELTWVLLAVDREQFGGAADPDAKVTVNFADTVSESQLTRAQTVTMLHSADAASTRTLVELFHNDRDGEWVDAEVIAIHREQGLGDPTSTQDAVPPQHDQGLPPAGTEATGGTGLDLGANLDS